MKTEELGNVARIVSGATPKTSVPQYWGGGIPWVTPADLGDLDNAYISDTPRTLTATGLQSCAASLLPTNSVLLSSRAPIGHVAINVVPMATNQGFKSVVPGTALDSKYLYHWLRSHRDYLQSMGDGATFKELSKRRVEAIKIPLPALAEQRRIAVILDQADALRVKRRQVLAHLDTLTQSIFGEVARDAPAGVTLGEIAEFRYGTSNKSGSSGYPTLRIPNVIGGVLNLDSIKTVAVDHAEFERLRLLPGDLLFVRSNGNPDNVGRAAVFETDGMESRELATRGWIYASYLIRARLASGIAPQVVAAFLGSREGRTQLRERARTSAGQFNINTVGLGSIVIPSLTEEQQKQFVRRSEHVRLQRQRVGAASAAEDRLYASLQSRAFRGEL